MKWTHNIQNLWDVSKSVLGGKFITMNAFIKKEKPQINSPTVHFKKLEKQQ